MPVLAFFAMKGGCGKSTLALAVAAELMNRSASVALVDTDTDQGTASLWHRNAEKNGNPTPTLRRIPPKDLDTAKGISVLAKSHGWVIIDCAGSLAPGVEKVLKVADLVIIPCQPSPADVGAMAATTTLVRGAVAVRDNLQAAIVITRAKASATYTKEARKTLEQTGFPVMQTMIGDREAYKHALGLGIGVSIYDRGQASVEVNHLVDEIEGAFDNG